MLIYHTTGKVVPEGKLPIDVGCVVLNSSTTAFIGKYLRTGMPLVSKTVTVDGGAVNEFFSELALTHDVRTSLQKIYDKNDYINGVRDALQKWNDYIESQLPNEYLELIIHLWPAQSKY